MIFGDLELSEEEKAAAIAFGDQVVRSHLNRCGKLIVHRGETNLVPGRVMCVAIASHALGLAAIMFTACGGEDEATFGAMALKALEIAKEGK